MNYNLKADVYSWTIVFHVMMSLSNPFHMYDANMHKLYVCQQGVRPTVIPEWPSEIQRLFRRGWAQDPNQRPTIKQVSRTLESMLKSLEEREEIPGQTLIEASHEVMGHCTNQLCKDHHVHNKHASNMLRLLEMHMMGSTKVSFQNRFRSEHPHLQHLRSQYL